ncbi:MAG: homocysteine S-methyltransferase family protein [candidate division Zixibacteria bacterium]|nr:homocysteine S-methyltransferase family protein [candidate division Zixibacteria bacterium]
MESLLKRLKNGEILVADGAMGTMLFDYGLKPGEPPESFNLTRSEVLEEIARLYLDAGADIIQTNTFGASPLRLSLYSLDDKTEEINRNAVLAVRKVVGDRAYISASCGPSGRLLKPYGDTEPEEIYNSFVRQMNALISAGVDAICVETMTDLTEATLAIRAAKTVSPSTPVMATMTFDPTPKGFYTVMGTSIEDAAQGLKEAGADVIGSNCGNGIENMIKIAKEFKRYSQLPIIIQSNAGIPEMQGDKPVYPETPEFMAEKAKELVSSGVSIIGGCCGTTPEHVRAIRKMVDQRKQIR